MCLDCQDTLEDKGLRDHSASLEGPGSRERKDEGVQQVSPGPGAKEVLMEPGEEEEQMGPLESLEKKALVDKTVLQVLPENRAPKDHRDETVNQDPKGPMVRPVKMEYQVTQAREGARASKAKTDPPAP